jgi:phosphoribosylaminoimidazole-succinocarboxamide synthase
MEKMNSKIMVTETLLESRLPLPLLNRGKVRDIYDVAPDKLLIVVTDRLSAFDVVLPTPIPYKGKVLNQISSFWFDFFKRTVAHHLLTDRVEDMDLPPEVLSRFGPSLEGRCQLVRKAKPLPVECVVRGYLAGSGWKDYLKTGTVCGHRLPPGLKQCGRLPEPLFTPSTKAVVGHDENIDFASVAAAVGRETAEKIRGLTLGLYQKGAEWAEGRGIIIADTKFEFGILDGNILLIDEVLTPDSSRFWPKEGYAAGHDQPSFDKQIVRNHLEQSEWNKKPPAPSLPAGVIEKTSQAYQDAYRRLTGKELLK